VALSRLDYPDMEDLMQRGMNDRDAMVRTAALGLMDEVEVSAERLPGLVNPIFARGTLEEQQQMLRVLGKMPEEKSAPVLSELLDRYEQNRLDQSISLDLIEAVEAVASGELIARLEPLRSDDYSEALYGGNARMGGRLFYTHAAAQCTRCHAIRGDGTEVGPSLGGIGSRLTREQLVEALVEPGARLAPGYGTVILTLTDGQTVSGILLEEHDQEIVLRTSEAEPLHIETSRISERRNGPSSMPAMGNILTTREIRDLVEFLAGLE